MATQQASRGRDLSRKDSDTASIRPSSTRRVGGDDRIVAMERFEHYKENIQPVKSGRSATALAVSAPSPSTHASSSSSASRAVELEMKKAEFERRVTEEERDAVADPLVTWMEYIKWARV